MYVTTSVNVTCPPILLLRAVVAGPADDDVIPGRTPPSVIEIVAELVAEIMGEDATGGVEDAGGSPLLLAPVDDAEGSPLLLAPVDDGCVVEI